MNVGDVFINKYNKDMICIYVGKDAMTKEDISIVLMYHKKIKDFKIMSFYTKDLKEQKVLKNIKLDLVDLLGDK